MERQSLGSLPQEQAEQLFRFLPPQDLCNIVSSSSSMWTLASNPKLWTRMKVKRVKIHQYGLKMLFDIKRFAKIRKINLSRMTFTLARLLSNMNALASSSVEDLNLEGVKISQVPSAKLAQVAGGLCQVNLAGTHMTNDQVLGVLEVCISSNTLVNINLKHNSLSTVPAELVGQAAKHLEVMILEDTDLNIDQCTAVLEACVSSNTLVSLNMTGNYLKEVPAKLLAQAAKHLHKLNLGNTHLSTEQITAVLETCVSSNTLVSLNLAINDIDEVPVQVLGKAAKHLLELNLRCTLPHLTIEQLTAVLEACVSSNTLEKISLGLNNLKDVPAQLLAQAAKHLKEMNLKRTGLNTEQMTAVLDACVSSNTLKSLNITENDLGGVPAELLARARETGRISGSRLDNIAN